MCCHSINVYKQDSAQQRRESSNIRTDLTNGENTPSLHENVMIFLQCSFCVQLESTI